jgi:predicted amidohydrolase
MAFPIAAVQFSIDPGEVLENREALALLAQEAVGRGAKLVLFPEASVSDLFRGAQTLAETVPGPTTELLQKIAGDAVLAVPLLEQSTAGVHSACVFIGRDGVRGIARKSHFYRDSRGFDSFQDGDVLTAAGELSVIDLGEIKCGVLLGFDSEFPEAFRTLALRGADVILVALNQLEPDYNLLAAMAVRNRLPVVVANRLGFRRVYPLQPEFSAGVLSLLQEKDGTFLMRCRGNSGILDVFGNLAARPHAHILEEDKKDERIREENARPVAHFQEDEILMASFHFDELRVERLTSPYLSQRRTELYER